MLARHEMPGMCHPKARPVGYGMIGWRQGLCLGWWTKRGATDHTVPYGTDRVCPLPGIYAWLPSFRPSGTKHDSLVNPTQNPEEPKIPEVLPEAYSALS